jgi:nucleoside-diphosphate-sugar epimerase
MSALNMKSLLAVSVASLVLSVSAFSPVSSPATKTSVRASSALSMSNGGVVVTGSAGGVGYAYAGEFMDRGYDVVISDVRDCTAAAKALTSRHPNGNVYYTKCDVSDAKSVEKLAAFAKKNLGTVNYWINNAGVNGGRRALRDVPISQVELVVKVNLMGTLLCTKAAMDIMGDQVSKICFNVLNSSCSIIANILCNGLGWSDWSHFPHCRKWRKGRRYPWVCLLRSDQAWFATTDRQSR